jgi:arylsulfatase A-like enzyme
MFFRSPEDHLVMTLIVTPAANRSRAKTCRPPYVFSAAVVCITMLCSAAVGPTATARAQQPKPPNIVFIFTDDQRWDTVGALGNPEIHTPNVDRLVQRGFHFNNAYCMGSMVGAVCLPSRTMVMTGRSLWRIPDNPRGKVAPPGVPLLPVLLNDAGYVTFRCGKAGNSCTFGNAKFTTNISTRGRTPTSATEHTDKVLEFLRNHDGARPFYVYLAPPVPHDPRTAPSKFMKLYDPASLSLSKNFMPRHPFDNGELKVRDEMLAPVPRTEDVMRQHLAEYYATLSDMDHQVGRIMTELQQRGFAENTVVIYSSDQGLAVGGRHGLMGKQNLYEHVKPPLIVAGPGIKHGQSDALVYLHDLFPTICDLAGAPTPQVVEGASLMGIIGGQQSKVRDSLLAAYKDCQRMVRDDRWKLIQYNAGGVKNTQLFDLRNDPDELHDLADDPAFAAQRKRLERLMTRERKRFADPVDFQAATASVGPPSRSTGDGLGN